ncbi:hypothetical protein [Streptomyces sp. NPDC059009]|uniref:hypothetical protein n=1 Tax=Streptomyces sp. NPDC059009 TaxID=3346694 RepID=UPI00368D935E
MNGGDGTPGLGEPFAVHTLSHRLDGIQHRLPRAALTRLGLLLGLIACALPFALRLLLLLVRGDSWVAYVLLVVVATGLLVLLTEVNYFGGTWYFTLGYAVAAVALTLFCWNGHSADVLAARGRWTPVTVTELVTQPRQDPACRLSRVSDGSRLARDLDDCGGLARGDRLTVLEDPEGEVGPERSAPSTVGTYVAAGISGAALVSVVACAFAMGRRTRSTNPNPDPNPNPNPNPTAHPNPYQQ